MADPILDGLTPTSSPADSGVIEVHLNGKNFTLSSTLLVDDTMVATEDQGFISDTEVWVNISTDGVDAGQKMISVDNEGVQSNTVNFEITAAVAPPDPVPPEVVDASPNTPAVPAEYMAPDPPDVYRQVATPDGG